MIVAGAHLTYCTNIHPGETWPKVRRALETHTCEVKRAVCPDRPFGVGLRLSAAAAAALAVPAALEELRGFLRARGLYVFSINGFPFGPFHGTVVKENVYRPDWREPERSTYSDRLAALLAALLPDGPAAGFGSVSTVPGAFKARTATPEAAAEIAARLRAHAAVLQRLHVETGQLIALALEPEPECLLETTADAIAFFETHVLSRDAVAAFGASLGLGATEAEATLRRHLGVCVDACHAAVEFEDPALAITGLERAGIAIAKLQISAGLRVPHPTPEARRALARFAEGVYLHQVVIRRGGRLERIVDLPEALARVPLDDPGDEWRVHFHVPLFASRLGPFENTAGFVSTLLRRHAERPISPHLEVETYTWDVLPEEHRGEPVAAAIARELRFALDALSP